MRKQQYLTLSSQYQMDKSQVLGKGSTGQVYLGKQINSGQPVAIKMIKLQTIDNEVTQYLLKMQKIALQSITHQNVLKGFKIIQNSSKCYMITQYCNGGTLKNLIRKQGCLKEDKSIQIIKGILKGYNALVRKGIVHRDLKPANIMFHNNISKIIDFGYCQIRGHQKPSLEYNVGSPSYMAPESFQNNVYNEKTQIWAIGIILYECIFGKTFDDGKHMSEIYKSMKKYGIPFTKQISQKSKKIISWCLEFDPNRRPTTLELLNSLIQNKNSDPDFMILNKTERKKSNSIYYNNFVSEALQKKKYSAGEKKVDHIEVKSFYPQQIVQNVIKKQARSNSKQGQGLISKTERNQRPINNMNTVFEKQIKRQKITSFCQIDHNQYGLQKKHCPENQKVLVFNQVPNQQIQSFTSCKLSPREELIKKTQKKISFNLAQKNPESLRDRFLSGHVHVDGYYQKAPSHTYRPSQKLGKLKMGIRKQNIQMKPGQYLVQQPLMKKQNIYNSILSNYPEMRHSSSIYQLNNYIKQKERPISIFNTVNVGQKTCR